MQHMLIGSKALEFWKAPEVEVRKSDWDIITDSNDFGKSYDGQRIETFSLNELNNKEMMQFGLDMNVKINDIPVLICSPTGLAIIKRSHLHRPWFFKKHISMFHNYKLRSGDTLSEIIKSIEQDSDLMTILKNRTSLTKLAYGDKTPKLNVSNEKFFDNAVQHFTVHHDLIHIEVADNLKCNSCNKTLKIH